MGTGRKKALSSLSVFSMFVSMLLVVVLVIFVIIALFPSSEPTPTPPAETDSETQAQTSDIVDDDIESQTAKADINSTEEAATNPSDDDYEDIVGGGDETGGEGNGEDGGGGGGGGDGGGGGMGNADGGEGQEYLKVKTQNVELLYFRYRSYGNYTGLDWDEKIPSYGSTEDLNPMMYLSVALKNAGYTEKKMEVLTNMSRSYSPYHFSSSDLCDPDDRVIPYGGKKYSTNYYYEYDVTVLQNLSLSGTEFASDEQAYRSFVKSNYLTIDPEVKTVLLKLAKENGLNATDPQIISKVASYIQNAATYNLYHEEYPIEENQVVYFLTVAKEGVCVEFASSATLMYRSLGIPARYVTGYLTTTLAGEWTVIDVAIGHAWVEVYVDGIGWIPVEATPASNDESIETPPDDNSDKETETITETETETFDTTETVTEIITGTDTEITTETETETETMTESATETVTETVTETETETDDAEQTGKSITVSPIYVSKQYDGTPLYAVDQIRGFDKWEDLGYWYSVTVSGSQTDYGYGESIIEELTIFSPEGIDVTEEFKIKTQKGRLHVYYSVLTSYSYNVTKLYDQLAVNVSEVYPRGELMSGHYVSEINSKADTSVGTRPNLYEIIIRDTEGKDVSSYYKFNNSYGTLTITPISLTVKALDASKVYDGTPLEYPEYEITSGELLEGHTVSNIEIEGSQTEIGKSYQIVSEITIIDAHGKDVTANYAIILVPGKLTVTKE